MMWFRRANLLEKNNFYFSQEFFFKQTSYNTEKFVISLLEESNFYFEEIIQTVWFI